MLASGGPVLAEQDELRALESPVFLDVRGKDEIASSVPSAPGSINIVWNMALGKFEGDDPTASLPADKVRV